MSLSSHIYSINYAVPEGLVSELGIPMNIQNMYFARTSPPSVHKANLDQLEKDFTTNLKSCSDEFKG